MLLQMCGATLVVPALVSFEPLPLSSVLGCQPCRNFSLASYNKTSHFASILLQDHGPLEEADVARIMYEALQTVAACHKHSLYHGDVKPANFMLRDEPHIGAKGLGLEK